ncbi:MAG: 4-hydroxy-tetrahydrodipicolinate reductase [Candidatus Omnitrophota bacterium]
MIKLGVLGAGGRMGRRIIELALNDKELEVILALERKGHHLIGKNIDKVKISSTPDGIFLADAIIDFTIPEASMENLAYCLQYNKPLVLATTGFNEEQTVKIRDAAKSIAIVFSPNMSVGVNLLFGVVGEIAKKLGPGYDIEMVEAHHKAKKDAPSGTAKKLAQVIANDTGRNIPVHAIRAGDIIGDHTVIYAGGGERIEIKHQAHSRDVFALGSLKAAKWIANKPVGLYSMQDVLKG